jgi:glycosyltransferase involved in cell wall biosynthesis
MRVLFILTYYRPHVSGLTIYVERLAKALAQRGHQVTVLTAHFAKQLPYEEVQQGVRIVRTPVLFRFNKGVFMPRFTETAWREMQAADVVSIHLPQMEATLSAALARLAGHHPVLTYHCDLQMPPGLWYGPLVDGVTFQNNILAGRLADTIVAYTHDFASHSPVLSRFLDTKVRVILPPVVIPEPTSDGARALREQYGLNGRPVIGFAARFAYEKGASFLLEAIPHILAHYPDIHLLFAGPYLDVVGEKVWYQLQPLIKRYESHLTFLGTLNPAQMADFFAACDVITVASINNTESFGLVQVEAFLCGTPVVATNLPGVRQPVRMTGMGEIVPVADAQGLADGIVKVLAAPGKYIKSRGEITRMFELERTVDEYEKLFEEKRR